MPMYSSVEGGVSSAWEVNPTPESNIPDALTPWLITDKQLEFDRSDTPVCEVVVSDEVTRVLVAAIASGNDGSKLQARTTKTSLSSGDKLRSICVCANVLGAVSDAENPKETT